MGWETRGAVLGRRELQLRAGSGVRPGRARRSAHPPPARFADVRGSPSRGRRWAAAVARAGAKCGEAGLFQPRVAMPPPPAEPRAAPPEAGIPRGCPEAAPRSPQRPPASDFSRRGTNSTRGETAAAVLLFCSGGKRERPCGGQKKGHHLSSLSPGGNAGV